MEQFSFEVARTEEELQRVRNAWLRFQNHPNADYDYVRMVVGARPEFLSPFAIQYSENGVPKMLLVGRVERRRIFFRVGYMNFPGPMAKALVIVYGGILGDTHTLPLKRTVQKLKDEVEMLECDLVHFSFPRCDLGIEELLKEIFGKAFVERRPRVNLHYRLNIGVNHNDIYANISTKHRYWVRRMKKKFEKDYPDFKYIKLNDTSELEQHCKDIESVAKKTYQRGLKSGFFYSEEMIKKYIIYLQKRCLSSYILYVGQKPIAFWSGIRYGNCLFLEYTGYDPEFRKYEVGTNLFIHMMLEELANDVIKTVDYGFGDALYKKRFSNEWWKESSVSAYRNNAKGFIYCWLKSSINYLEDIARKISRKIVVENVLKRIWRHRLETNRG